jgi:MFS family permease
MRLRIGACMTETDAGIAPGSAVLLPEPSRRVVISALGITQILAWGTSYYLPAVLAKPISADTGWPLTWVVGGLSLGLVAAGLVSPRIGRAIHAVGGRPVLAASSVLLAIGLAILALASNIWIFLAAWLLIGLGMGAGLYDAAFATLGRAYGSTARSAITTLTLWGGFASTVCWPLSALLVEHVGWRGACWVYAGIQIALGLPIHLLLLPRPPPPDEAASLSPSSAARPIAGVLPVEAQPRAFLLIAIVVTLGAATASAISVHLLTVLQARGFDLAMAVALGALIGPSQVGARIVESAFGRHYHPIWTMMACTLLLALGIGLLLVGFPVVAIALAIYGAGNGLTSVSKGTVPLALFGPGRYAVLMGRLALPGLLAQALAPSVGALLIEFGGANLLLAALFVTITFNVAMVGVLWAYAKKAGRHPHAPPAAA